MAGRRVVLLGNVATVADSKPEPVTPLSLLAVASCVRSYGFDPVIIDAQVRPDWLQLLRDELDEQPLFLGLTALTGPSIRVPLQASRLVRAEYPETPLVWGGYHATQAYEGLFREDLADYVVRGAGELALPGLLDSFALPIAERYEALGSVPNLVWKRNDEVRVNPQLKVASMRDVPVLDYDLLEVEEYFTQKHRHLHYISSYGCPHACTFCAEPAQSLRRWRGHDAKRVVDDLAQLTSRYRPDRINLMDPNYSSSPRRIVEIVAELERRDLVVPMLCDMRARDVVMLNDLMDLRRLRAAGCDKVFVGVESGSDSMLKRLRKGSQVADARRACELLTSSGIGVFASFVHDFPDESDDESEETLAFARELCRLPLLEQSHHFFTPYPLTELYEQMIRAGLVPEARNKTQDEWADTSTYFASGIWSGRPRFRRRVLRSLHRLRREFPSVVGRDALPVLTPVKARRGEE